MQIRIKHLTSFLTYSIWSNRQMTEWLKVKLIAIFNLKIVFFSCSFSWSLSLSRAFFLSFFLFFLIVFLVESVFTCFLTFLFSFINSHLGILQYASLTDSFISNQDFIYQPLVYFTYMYQKIITDRPINQPTD